MKTELVKPIKKAKRDGEVNELRSDDGFFLVMRGDYSSSEIIDAAIKQSVITAEEVNGWNDAEYEQCWCKTTPCNGDYHTWNNPRQTPCRGAYFASSLFRY